MATAGIPARKIGSSTAVPGDFAIRVGQFGYAFIFPPQPSYYALSFNFDTDLGMLNPSMPLDTYSSSADIKSFVNYGHKIIWYHGHRDPGPPVLAIVKYYQQMAQQFGGLDSVEQFSRLYTVPDMGHCSGGPATDRFDLLSPLADRVETGIAPGRHTGDRHELHTRGVPSVLRGRTNDPNATAMSLSTVTALYRQRVEHRR